MRRASPVIRNLTSLVLLATTAVGGWMAACAHPRMVVRAHLAAAHRMHEAHVSAARRSMHGGHMAAMHRMMYGALHHPPRPAPPPLPDDWAECPSMAMNGGSCLSAARADVELAPALTRLQAEQYPPAADVRDRLPNDPPFHPPRARSA